MRHRKILWYSLACFDTWTSLSSYGEVSGHLLLLEVFRTTSAPWCVIRRNLSAGTRELPRHRHVVPSQCLRNSHKISSLARAVLSPLVVLARSALVMESVCWEVQILMVFFVNSEGPCTWMFALDCLQSRTRVEFSVFLLDPSTLHVSSRSLIGAFLIIKSRCDCSGCQILLAWKISQPKRIRINNHARLLCEPYRRFILQPHIRKFQQNCTARAVLGKTHSFCDLLLHENT